MNCPKCGKDNFDESGNCPSCGYTAGGSYSTPAAHRTSEPESTYLGAIPVDLSGPSGEEGGELPPWRQELSRRLQEIKRKREGGDQPDAAADEPPPPFPSEKEESAVITEPAPQPEPLRRRPSRPKLPPLALPPTIASPGVAPAEPATQAEPEPRAELRLVQPPKPTYEPQDQPVERPPAQHWPGKDSGDTAIRDLIDNAAGRRSIASDEVPEILVTATVVDEPGEGKLILLSRTLGGLVDILVVVLCTGGLVLAVDFFSGISVLDEISLLNYGLLLLSIHLLYSLFFLSAAGQTIGMMITDLRIVRPTGERPSPGRLFLWCLLFLPALLALAIGVIWALFDSDARCLHDRLSGTCVERV